MIIIASRKILQPLSAQFAFIPQRRLEYLRLNLFSGVKCKTVFRYSDEKLGGQYQ